MNTKLQPTSAASSLKPMALPATGKTTPLSSTHSITGLSATQLVQQISRGDLSATEAVEAHIAQIERVNPYLNAVVVKRYEAARSEARAADARRKAGEALGALHGLPITVKECLDLTDSASTFGLPSRAAHRAGKDERHVARLREAGAIVLGKTNVAQLLFYYEADNPLYGRTQNPWNLTRTPGGSSGGEAAIVATGGSALGIGTDIGGSMRIPAAFCGLASIKPTAGRTPDMGRFSVPVGQRAVPSQVGVMARQVEDVALGLEVINGSHDSGVPSMPLGNFRNVDVSQLRVAYYTDDGTFTVAPAVARAVQEAAEMLRSQGAQVTAWRPPQADEGMDLLFGIFAADGGRLMRAMLGKDKRTPQVAQILMMAQLPHGLLKGMGALLHSLGQHGMANSIRAFGHSDTAHYWQLAEQVLDYQTRFQTALDQDAGGPFDVILSPACALPAFTHGSSRELLTAGAYTCLYNTLGYPAGVVPVTRVGQDEQVGRKRSRDMTEQVALAVEQGSAGLPIAVQVVARPWREDVTLGTMHAIKQLAKGRANYPCTPVEVATM